MSVLPDLLASGASAKNPSNIILRGKVNREVSVFPVRVELAPGEELFITRTGGLPVYVMDYVNERVTEAKTGGDGFQIRTTLNDDDMVLEAGRPVALTVEVDVNRDASFEYVMIEVPIPGTCSYGDERQSNSYVETHREYFQDRTVIFCEKMKAGKYFFQVDLLPRFSGKYLINPAQVSLMYFPVINANTDMKAVRVR